MKYVAQISIMPLKELLDPQGKAVKSGLANMGISGINDVRIGKHIQLEVEAANAEIAGDLIKQACDKLLHNAVMESYSFELAEK